MFVVVVEALTKHQAADHIGNRAAQEEGGIKGCGWREKYNCLLRLQY